MASPYSKLQPANMRVETRGRLATGAQSLLLDALEALQQQLGAQWDRLLASPKIFWLNVWQDEEDMADGHDRLEIADADLASALDRWCREAARSYCKPGAIVDGYGFVVNPVGTTDYQPWHIDYSTDAAVVWIPITPWTVKNGMQYVHVPEQMPRDVLETIACTPNRIDYDLLVASADGVAIEQLVSDPMAVFYMGRGTVHRGIPNRGDHARIGFYVSVHYIEDYDRDYPYPLGGEDEPAIATFLIPPSV